MAGRDDLRKRLPSGTVTLLFADIEGSTRLLNSLRGGFAPVRARLRQLVREAAATRGGQEVDWAGDGVFLAFPRATDAVLAATELQRALENEPWPPDAVVRLRIGIHTGEPDLADEGTWGWTSSSPRGSVLPHTAARSWSQGQPVTSSPTPIRRSRFARSGAIA